MIPKLNFRSFLLRNLSANRALPTIMIICYFRYLPRYTNKTQSGSIKGPVVASRAVDPQ